MVNITLTSVGIVTATTKPTISVATGFELPCKEGSPTTFANKPGRDDFGIPLSLSSILLLLTGKIPVIDFGASALLISKALTLTAGIIRNNPRGNEAGTNTRITEDGNTRVVQ